jgi:RsiW-degrading membrane proteinase PrsW (M82 family)
MGGGYARNSGRPSPSYSFSRLVPIQHWARDPALRSWPVLLLVALVCVPPIALVMLNNPTEAKIHDIAWIFAVYFAVAWLLLLGVIVRPQHVTRSMLAAIAVVGIVTEAPTAIFLETRLHSSTGSLLDVFTIGIPEELAKAIPIVVVAWIWRRDWRTQAPRDYLFLGAVSGLVFGAAEVVHYFTDVLGSLSGNATGLDLQDITIQYVWRFLTDPIDHAMWAGITGYFIGLAITGPYRKYSLGLVGIGIAAVLHGLNDWNPINSHAAWVVITLVSVLLFLGYARAGAWRPEQTMAASPVLTPPGEMPPPQSPSPPQSPPPPGARAPGPGHASPAAPVYGASAGSGARPGAGAPAAAEAWWQHLPAASAQSNPASPASPPPPASHPSRISAPSPAPRPSLAPRSSPAYRQSSPATRPPEYPPGPGPQPAHASPVPPDGTVPQGVPPYADPPRHPATGPTVVQPRPSPKPWWEQ